MIKFNCVVIAIALISCDRKPDISGHWVSVPDDDRENYYTTIDIIDSLLITGKGSLTQRFGPDTFIIRGLDLAAVPDFEGKERLSAFFEVDYPGPPYHQAINYSDIPDSVTWYGPYASVALRNDTLVADGGHMYTGGYFVRGEPHFVADLFADQNVDIDLVKYEGKNCNQKSTRTWINVGRSKSEHVQKGSLKIQVSDVFIDVTGIPQFLQTEKLKLELSEREKLAVALAVDKNTPVAFVKKVVETIREYDPEIEISFPVLHYNHENVCYLDCTGFLALIEESRQ